MSFELVKIPGFGRADLKKAGLGPDAMMQLALQLAASRTSALGKALFLNAFSDE